MYIWVVSNFHMCAPMYVTCDRWCSGDLELKFHVHVHEAGSIVSLAAKECCHLLLQCKVCVRLVSRVACACTREHAWASRVKQHSGVRTRPRCDFHFLFRVSANGVQVAGRVGRCSGRSSSSVSPHEQHRRHQQTGSQRAALTLARSSLSVRLYSPSLAHSFL